MERSPPGNHDAGDRPLTPSPELLKRRLIGVASGRLTAVVGDAQAAMGSLDQARRPASPRPVSRRCNGFSDDAGVRGAGKRVPSRYGGSPSRGAPAVDMDRRYGRRTPGRPGARHRRVNPGAGGFPWAPPVRQEESRAAAALIQQAQWGGAVEMQ